MQARGEDRAVRLGGHCLHGAALVALQERPGAVCLPVPAGLPACLPAGHRPQATGTHPPAPYAYADYL